MSPSDAEPFSYRTTKDGRVLISWNGKMVTTLVDERARRFLTGVSEADGPSAQLFMAKATGNFKRGNERPGTGHDKRV